MKPIRFLYPDKRLMFVDSITQKQASILWEACSKTKDHLYLGFDSPLGISARAMTEDFYQIALMVFGDRNLLHNALRNFCREYYLSGIDLIFQVDNHQDPIEIAKKNASIFEMQWEISKEENGDFCITCPQLKSTGVA